MKPDVKKHLKIADEVLREMEHLMAGGYYKGVVGRAYSAMFHAASAAIMAGDVEGRTRQGIVQTFEDTFIKTGLLDKKFHQYFRQTFNTRTGSDSPSFASADHREAQRTLIRTKDFIAVCRKLCE